MKPDLCVGMLAALSVLGCTAALADPVSSADVEKAQIDMIVRVDRDVTKYANELGIDAPYLSYCRSDMHLRTFNHPANGAIPFGVNYNSITDSTKLSQVISVREDYERSFLMLCLANAKNVLAQAAKR